MGSGNRANILVIRNKYDDGEYNQITSHPTSKDQNQHTSGHLGIAGEIYSGRLGNMSFNSTTYRVNHSIEHSGEKRLEFLFPLPVDPIETNFISLTG